MPWNELQLRWMRTMLGHAAELGITPEAVAQDANVNEYKLRGFLYEDHNELSAKEWERIEQSLSAMDLAQQQDVAEGSYKGRTFVDASHEVIMGGTNANETNQ